MDEFQALCQVQSDKASVEITSRYKGRVTRVLFGPGDIVKVRKLVFSCRAAYSQSCRIGAAQTQRCAFFAGW